MKLFVLLLLFPLCAMADATSDFAARCNGPGVIVCNGFDSSGDLAEGSIQQAYDDTDQFALNTDQKASGASSLRATFRSGVNSTNIGGAWSMNLPQTFDAGDTLYVQVRFRVTQAYITNNADYWGNSSIKLMNIHGDSSTCQGSEFTTTYGDGWFGAYTSCGTAFKTGTASTAMVTSCPGDCLLQNGSSFTDGTNVGYNCHYQSQSAGDGNGDGCFNPTYDTWYTFYQRIKFVTCGGTSGNEYDHYIAEDDRGYLQIHRVTAFTWNNNLDCYVNRLRLETYMTEISGSAPTTAYIWYDELIVSTQPIVAPGKSPAPFSGSVAKN